MADLLIFNGAPGSGKTTIGELLREEKKFPLVDFGWLRQGHLDNEWSNANEEEESMAFENLLFIVQNYLKCGYKNIMVNDLEPARVVQLATFFNDKDVKIISLIISNDIELRKRVLTERDSGYKNADAAIEWNRDIVERESLPNEHRIDNTNISPEEAAQKIVELY